MRKVIETSHGEVVLECNAATTIVGKKIFGFDFLDFFQNVEGITMGERMEKFEMVGYTMKVMAEKPLKEAMQTDSDGFVEWLAGFDFEEMTNIILPEVSNLWMSNQKTSSNPKN